MSTSMMFIHGRAQEGKNLDDHVRHGTSVDRRHDASLFRQQ
jgi:hypothetical protein